MASKRSQSVSFSANGTLTLPSDPEQLKQIVTHLFQYTYSNIKLDYDKICKRIDEEISESDSDSYDWEEEYEPGENDCKLDYKVEKSFESEYFSEKPYADSLQGFIPLLRPGVLGRSGLGVFEP